MRIFYQHMMNQSHCYRAAVVSRGIHSPGGRPTPQERSPANHPLPAIQNEQQYLRVLKRLLQTRILQQDLDEILGDLSEHFRMGRAAGRTEDDLIRSLGSPGEIAREVRLMHKVHPAMPLQTLSTGHR